jgi:CheY-like chemotaxis protein
MTTTSRAALLISRDLFFISRVTGTASSLGIEMQVAANAQAAAQIANAETFQCIFIDLADEGLDVSEFFASYKARPSVSDLPVPVIAFGSHVATARLQAAREAGCTDVMPRSRFSTSLPELLQKHCGQSPGNGRKHGSHSPVTDDLS